MEKLGIDVVKKDLVFICKVINKADKALEDDKISLTEGVGLALELPKLIGVIKTSKVAYAQLKDIDEEERLELVATFEAEFDLRNDKAEEVVESIIGVVSSIAVALIVKV